MSTKYYINDIIDFITNGDGSELSELSDDEDDYNSIIDNICEELNYGENSEETGEPNHNSKDNIDNSKSNKENPLENIYEEDNVQLAGVTENKKHVFRWRNNDVPQMRNTFSSTFRDPSQPELTPL